MILHYTVSWPLQSGGSGIWTHDLENMNLTSYQTAPPRDKSINNGWSLKVFRYRRPFGSTFKSDTRFVVPLFIFAS